MTIYMHPRCSLLAWESLARETGLGVTNDNRGRIHLSSEPLAYHPPEKRAQEHLSAIIDILLRT